MKKVIDRKKAQDIVDPFPDAGIVVGKVGTATATCQELKKTL